MGHQKNNSKLKVAYVVQTHRKRLEFDYLEVEQNWSKSQVIEALRTVYLSRVYNGFMTGFQRLILCQNMVLEVRSMQEVSPDVIRVEEFMLISQISFDDGEAYILPARVFLTSGPADESLTEVFNLQNTSASRAFYKTHPDLVSAAKPARLAQATKVLFLRRSFNRGHAVALQLLILVVMAGVGLGIGIGKNDVEAGAAVGGALFAFVASAQVSLLWLYR